MFEKISYQVGVETYLSKLCRERAAMTPDRPVATLRGRSFTYGEVDAAADGLAQAFVDRLGEGFASVLVYGRDVEDWLVAMVATNRANKAFVGADASVPDDRLAIMAKDADIRLVVSQKPVAGLEHLEHLSGLGHRAAAPVNVIATDSPYFMSFTSGSTGRPKAVAWWRDREVATGIAAESLGAPDLRLGLPLGHVTTLWGSMLSMALIVGDVELFDIVEQPIAEMAAWIEECQIQSVLLVPSILRMLLASSPTPSQLATLEVIGSGGEPISRDDFDALAAVVPHDARFVAHYGSTESGMVGLAFLNLSERPDDDRPLIFTSVQGGTIEVRDEDDQSVEPGEVGELVAASPAPARSYFNDPVLTAETFRLDEQGRRWVRTGDAAELLDDQHFVLRGRIDRMIKLRGHRVDLVEIESALRAKDGVLHAGVVTYEGRKGALRLGAYVALQPGADVDPRRLREELATQLPRHMVPDAIEILDVMPMLPSGKVALNDLPPFGQRSVGVIVPPRTPLEVALVELACREFALDALSVDADLFFDVGIDSLDLQQLFAAMVEELDIDLSLAIAAEAPTIAALARRIEAGDEAAAVLIHEGDQSQPPLVVIHGGYGTVLFASTLAAGLPDEVAVWGISFPHHIGAGRQAPPATLEELASLHLATLLEIQPEDPYRIAGYSAGGVIAVEIVHQLEAAGHTVELLVLIDPPSPGTAPEDFDGLHSRRHENAMLRERLRSSGLRGWRHALAIQRQRERQRRKVRAELDRHRRHGGAVAPFARDAYQSLIAAAWINGYRPPAAVAAPILYVTSSSSEPDSPFETLTSAACTVFAVEADHPSLVNAVNGPKIGQAIDRRLSSEVR